MEVLLREFDRQSSVPEKSVRCREVSGIKDIRYIRDKEVSL